MPLRISLLAAIIAVSVPASAPGQAKKSDSVVKVTATATKPDAAGKQVVTVTMKMDKGWHTYANPVDNEDLKNAKTIVTVTGKQKLQDVKIDYPPGKLAKDKFIGEYKIYEDMVDIKATVTRAKGDTGPLEVSVQFQACTEKQCLLTATVKLMVP